MRTNLSQQEVAEGTAKKASQPEVLPSAQRSQTPSETSMMLDLQRTRGNRFVGRMLAAQQAEAEGGAETTAAAAPAAKEEMPVVKPPEMSLPPPREVKVELRPHAASESTLRMLAPFYRQGRTPFFDLGGNVQTFEKAPLTAEPTGRQLETIHERFGEPGLAQTMRGLSITRGHEFALSALEHAPAARQTTVARAALAANVDGQDEYGPVAARLSRSPAASPAQVSSPGGMSAGVEVASALSHVGAGKGLPEGMRRKLSVMTGDDLGDVRVHHDAASERAADMLSARAFTIGRSVYFGRGEYRPDSPEGERLMAHEVAHAVQQKGAALPPTQELRVSRETDDDEVEAERFAGALECSRPDALSLAPRRLARAARIQRAISFARSGDAFIRNSLLVNESAAGFTVQANTLPLFSWFADVTISGNAGDPFGNFVVGPHQVCHTFLGNFHWDSTPRSRRRITVSTLPIRDATSAANTWYHDPFASAAFAASGDVRNTGLRDSPSPGTQPWAPPIAGRAATTGDLAFSAGFVAYISAQDTTAGTGAAAMRALNCVYWNSSISGSFDTTQAVGSRVRASGGNVNRGGIIQGGSGEFPSMHGGGIANDNFTTTDT